MAFSFDIGQPCAGLPPAAAMAVSSSRRRLKLSIGRRQPHEAFAEGNVLVSMSNINALFVVDMKKEAIVWGYRADFNAQHDPQIIHGQAAFIGGYIRTLQIGDGLIVAHLAV